MSHALISLGSNLGDRRQTLKRAVESLLQTGNVQLRDVSSWHETQPLGGPPGQPPFLNGAATLETSLSPQRLLAVLQEIEQTLQRRRDVRWGARTLDLDLLLYDDFVIESAELAIPHPRMAFRRFVLAPAVEVAADWVHPLIGWTLAALLAHLNEAFPYVAIAGPSREGKRRLADELLEQAPGRRIVEPADPPGLLAPGEGRSGLNWPAEIESLNERARLLDAGTLVQAKELTVSDFWFDELLVSARLRLPAAQRVRYDELWRAARRHVLSPKLLIWLDDDRAASPSGGWLEPYRSALAQRVEQPGQGPVLRLSAQDPQQATVEAAAAIAAMA